MKELYYIGLDVHKKSISYTIKQADGRIVRQGEVEARRAALSAWGQGRSASPGWARWRPRSSRVGFTIICGPSPKSCRWHTRRC